MNKQKITCRKSRLWVSVDSTEIISGKYLCLIKSITLWFNYFQEWRFRHTEICFNLLMQFKVQIVILERALWLLKHNSSLMRWRVRDVICDVIFAAMTGSLRILCIAVHRHYLCRTSQQSCQGQIRACPADVTWPWPRSRTGIVICLRRNVRKEVEGHRL